MRKKDGIEEVHGVFLRPLKKNGNKLELERVINLHESRKTGRQGVGLMA